MKKFNLKFISGVTFYLVLGGIPLAKGTEFSITMDDPRPDKTALFDWREVNKKILSALKSHSVKGTLFVCGMRIDNPEGKQLVTEWNDAGHSIANHSYSHLYFPDKQITLDQYLADLSKGENIISGFSNFVRLLRFPFLKEGDTFEKRDGVRKYLDKHKYRIGYVSVDASDWYISSRIEERLEKNSHADISGYRDYYLAHMWDRAQYYNDLSKKVLGREVKHTLLVHHNLLNALFLGDLISMFERKGWKAIDANEAFKDSVYSLRPDILPAGESVLWALAKQTGKYENILRYPGEDGEYEKDKMDKLGL